MLPVAQADLLGLSLDCPLLLQPYLVPWQVDGCPLNCTGVHFLGLSYHFPSSRLHTAPLLSPDTFNLFVPQDLCSFLCLSALPPDILSPVPQFSVGPTLTTTLQNITSNTPYPTPCFFSPRPITLSHIHNLLVYYFSFCLLHYNSHRAWNIAQSALLLSASPEPSMGPAHSRSSGNLEQSQVQRICTLSRPQIL